MLVDQLDRYCAFSNRRRHPLDRAMADITGSENSRHTGLKVERITLWFPTLGTLTIIDQVLPGENEPNSISLH
jgi:hypothetical protein